MNFTEAIWREAMKGNHPNDIPLSIPGFSYWDLYAPERLADLSDAFDSALQCDDPALFDEFVSYRLHQGSGLRAAQRSELLVRLAPHVGKFVARLFGVEHERGARMKATQQEFEIIFTFRREIVLAVDKLFRPEDLARWDRPALERAVQILKRSLFVEVADDPDEERALAGLASRLLALRQRIQEQASPELPSSTEARRAAASLRQRLVAHPQASATFAPALAEPTPIGFIEHLLDTVRRWTYQTLHTPHLQPRVEGWMSFKAVPRIDFSQLVSFEANQQDGYRALSIDDTKRRRRNGFALTDRRFTERQILFEVEHCIYCHDRDRDSCSKGMRKKDGTLRENPLGVTLTGCPLEEKISEAHLLKRGGDDIGALALITIDNPMAPGTGHRICNDCMKGCIYQKVEPVNIPQIETNILTDVLYMPYGFEIYSLLTRWNPLNVIQPCALPYNGKNILVVGLGPAGYTLSHYLLNEGFGVVGIDGLKIEPLPEELVGNQETLPAPIRDFGNLYDELDRRIMAGFGGVAEYGITVRWDKNFLKVIYLNLVRRRSFRCYGGIRFGGTLTIDDAWALGFDHIAIASGAGEPAVIGMKNNLIRGVRKSSDFLMALQLTGAAKRDSLANLQVRLPAAVIGGGLTAIDTATELLAYYPVQVEKCLERYETLEDRFGADAVLARYDEEERVIFEELLAHGRAVRAERERARAAGRPPDFLPLLRNWGGVTLYYRKGLSDSPAYRQNHEEIQKALEEGITIAPGMSPVEALADDYGHLCAVRFDRLVPRDGKWLRSGEQPVVPLRGLFIAAGTSPNIIYEREHAGSFEKEGKFFRRFEPRWENSFPTLLPLADTPVPKLGKPAPFTSYHLAGKYITFFGDNHPVYAGNVVKAMASAKDGYPYIARLFNKELRTLDPAQQASRDKALATLHRRLDRELVATVAEVNRLTPTIVEVVVQAPMQARQFRPGQFYRVQNLETNAPVVENTRLAAEGLALTGAWVDKERGLISLITLEVGASSKLCALWQPGKTLVLMGPTGAPTEIPSDENVLLVGGGLGNAVLFSIGRALREAGSRVLYFAGYRKPGDVFRRADLEAASDVLVWTVDLGPGIAALPTRRAQDKSFVGNLVQAMVAYGEGALGPTTIPLPMIDRLIVIGSDRMMGAVNAARENALKAFLKPQLTAVGSINSPMQCMMKGVCSQCLCKHIKPSGEVSFVYSCYNQDQRLDEVDFVNLGARLRQNSVQEKLADLWVDYVLERFDGERI
jgi:NADPH-dependent glutamate synthase beta subunit-like oxidoreductase/NAD(P)H-flavin reductase